MHRGYGQFCPLALAAELLCERWTLLIVSRLLDGCTQFNEIHRSLPRISVSLLAQRLDWLEQHGLVKRGAARKGLPRKYEVTPATRSLEAIIEQLAVWGQQWARDMKHDDLDPGFVIWSLQFWLNTSAMPASRTVLEFEFAGAHKDCRHFWLVTDGGHTDMCLKDPGYEIDLKVEADLCLFIEAWRGIRDVRKEIQARRIRLIGASAMRAQFPKWLQLSAFAPFPRRREGREQRLARDGARRTRSSAMGVSH